jgi:hypothetical protein
MDSGFQTCSYLLHRRFYAFNIYKLQHAKRKIVGLKQIKTGFQHGYVSGFRIPKILGFRIPLPGFRIPNCWIPDSKAKKNLDSGFRITSHGAKS